MKKNIKITIFCAQSFDMFTKDVLDENPINLDLRTDGNASGINEIAEKVVELIKTGQDFAAITVHDTALNVIGLLIAEGTLVRDNIVIKFYDENTRKLETATYDNQGFLVDWHLGYLSCWDYELFKKLR